MSLELAEGGGGLEPAAMIFLEHEIGGLWPPGAGFVAVQGVFAFGELIDKGPLSFDFGGVVEKSLVALDDVVN